MEFGYLKRGYELGLKDGHAYAQRACEKCGHIRWVKVIADTNRYRLCGACSNGLPRKNRRGASHPKWRGGVVMSNGYVSVLLPEHPYAQKHGYIKRARLVLEKKLGRLLSPEESSHHINGIKTDDRPENLEAKSNSAHIRGHAVGWKRDARGQFICQKV